MVRGVMLVKAGYAAALEICQAALKIKGVVDAYPVFGRFDAVVFIKAEDVKGLKKTALKILALKGVRSTETLIEAA
ncbi:MAG: Lrp/AsnC ligand binding domain-containing protein [Candidatus Brockarchaeota archaeon]|nr:Lrp/AsnC ligand binding domain-containing protein [Candidatus Brockarchaeota archaeon]MBO3842002.1 Lrp/AsnC ligand binding domain-containing protein [Candidatus Brockarchaeota archaeon]